MHLPNHVYILTYIHITFMTFTLNILMMWYASNDAIAWNSMSWRIIAAKIIGKSWIVHGDVYLPDGKHGGCSRVPIQKDRFPSQARLQKPARFFFSTCQAKASRLPKECQTRCRIEWQIEFHRICQKECQIEYKIWHTIAIFNSQMACQKLASPLGCGWVSQCTLPNQAFQWNKSDETLACSFACFE